MNHQYKWIAKALKENGIKNKALLQEMVDHYASMHEQHINSKSADDQPNKNEIKNFILAQIKNDDLKELNSEINAIHKPTKKIICMSTLLFLCLLFFSNSFFVSDSEPPSQWPLEQKHSVSSEFGMRIHPIKKKKVMHKGIDIVAKKGTPVLASASGKIIETDYNELLGHFIVIQHDAIYSSRYHHLSERTHQLGEQVSKGDVIGKVGSTGLSTAPHLHFEVIKNKRKVDPSDYLRL